MKTKVNRNKTENHLKPDIYSKKSDGIFYSPFSLSIDDMERLLLINFEKNPDQFYNILELQQASDKTGKRYFLVIAYRNDGRTDVYHQSLFPFASQASVLNEATFIVNPLEGAKFDINPDNLDVYFSFIDRYDRKIKVKIKESGRAKKRPFFLLAPIGTVAKNPESFPIYSLYEMSFSRQKYTDIEIEIDGVRHKPDTFPLPIDWSGNYFTRYSADTFNVDWNKNFYGQLLPLIPGENNKTEEQGVVYELVNNSGHYEIKCISTSNNRHHIYINFSPSIPDIACLKSGTGFHGNFIITTDKSKGTLAGEYYVKRQGDEIRFKLQPDKGWKPNENRYILRLLFLMVKVFRGWPKSYAWDAEIKLDPANHPVMRSAWKRIKI